MLCLLVEPQITAVERLTFDNGPRSWPPDKQKGMASKTVAVTGFFESTIARDISFLMQVSEACCHKNSSFEFKTPAVIA